MSGKLALDLRHMDERPVPARFKLARHQPVRRVSGIELPESPVCGIARRFEVATERIAHLIPSFPGILGGSGCRSDSARTDDVKQCFLAQARAHPPEDHLRRNARRWRSRPPGLLLGLQVQPWDAICALAKALRDEGFAPPALWKAALGATESWIELLD
jgi:hypothetical protein